MNRNSKFQNPCLRLPAVGRAGRQMSNECQSSVTQGFSLDLDQP
jgi:hypothetical protein